MTAQENPAYLPTRTVLAAEEQRALEHFVRVGLPLHCGGRRGRYVALTFDDGPGRYTALALQILRRAGARATFFDVGHTLALRSKLARAETAVGAVGDHTWTHPWLPGLSPRQAEWQVAHTQAALASVTREPVRLFRPPYGAHPAP